MQTDPVAALLSVIRSPSHRRRAFVVCLYWLAIFTPPGTLFLASTSESSMYFVFFVFLVMSAFVGFLLARLQLEVIQEHLSLEWRPLTSGDYLSMVAGVFLIYLASAIGIALLHLLSAGFFTVYLEATSEMFNIGEPEVAANAVSALASIFANAVVFGFLGYGLRAIAAGDSGWMPRAIGYASGRLTDPTGPEMVWIAYVYIVGGGLALVAGALSSAILSPAMMGFAFFAFAALNTVAFPLYYAQISSDQLGLIEEEEDYDTPRAAPSRDKDTSPSQSDKAELAVKLVAQSKAKAKAKAEDEADSP